MCSIDEDGPSAKRSRCNSNMSSTSDKPDYSDSECSGDADGDTPDDSESESSDVKGEAWVCFSFTSACI